MEHNPYAPPKANVTAVEPGLGEDGIAPFRDLSGLTRSLSILLLIGAALSVLSLCSSVLQLELLARENFSQEEADANDLREQVVASVDLIAYLITLIVFGRWIYLAHRNLPSLGASELKFRPGWAVGYFAVPIANLWMPYQAMRDLLRASESPAYWHVTDAPWYTVVWWMLWVASTMIGNYTLRTIGSADTIPELYNLTLVDIVGGVIAIPLYLLARLIVLRVWKHQLQARSPA